MTISRTKFHASAVVLADGTVSGSDGIESVDRTGVGVYEVTLTNAMAIGEACILSLPNGAIGVNRHPTSTLGVDGVTITIQFADTAGDPADSDFSLLVVRVKGF